MGVAGSLVVFFVAWWIAFQAMLPFGVRSQHVEGDVTPGTEPAAPVAPGLGRKALWSTGIAFVIWAALYSFTEFSGVTWADLWFPWPERS